MFDFLTFNFVSVFEKFGIDAASSIDFKFQNNLQAPIDVEDLSNLITQYSNSGCFFIELLLDQPSLSIRAEVIFVFNSIHKNMNDLTSILISECKQFHKRMQQRLYF